MIGDEFFDSPFTGLGTGTIVGHGVAVYPKDALEEWAYVSNIWTEFTAGVYDPVAGCCGTPLYNKDGGVVAFFRWFEAGGISRCPTPDPLINADWELADYSGSGALVPSDIDSYNDFLETARASYLTPTSSTSTMTPSQELAVVYNHLTENIEDTLANLPSKTFATETENFRAHLQVGPPAKRDCEPTRDLGSAKRGNMIFRKEVVLRLGDGWKGCVLMVNALRFIFLGTKQYSRHNYILIAKLRRLSDAHDDLHLPSPNSKKANIIHHNEIANCSSRH